MLKNQDHKAVPSETCAELVKWWADLSPTRLASFPEFFEGLRTAINGFNVDFKYFDNTYARLLERFPTATPEQITEYGKMCQDYYEYGRLTGAWMRRKSKSIYQGAYTGYALLPFNWFKEPK